MQSLEKTGVSRAPLPVVEAPRTTPAPGAEPLADRASPAFRPRTETPTPMLHDDQSLDAALPAPCDLPLSKRKLAEILVAMSEDESRERVSVADLLLAMEDRAFGALMLIFAMPNALPTPPGTSAILGAPLIFLAAQLTFGRKPWLPRVIADRSMLRADFAAMINKAAPWIAWAERLLKPRMSVLARQPAEYAIGAICLLMAAILFLPIPLGNMLPALSICLFSLGLLERDGVWVIAGFFTAILSTAIVAGVVYTLVMGAIFFISKGFA